MHRPGAGHAHRAVIATSVAPDHDSELIAGDRMSVERASDPPPGAQVFRQGAEFAGGSPAQAVASAMVSIEAVIRSDMNRSLGFKTMGKLQALFADPASPYEKSLQNCSYRMAPIRSGRGRLRRWTFCQAPRACVVVRARRSATPGPRPGDPAPGYRPRQVRRCGRCGWSPNNSFWANRSTKKTQRR